MVGSANKPPHSGKRAVHSNIASHGKPEKFDEWKRRTDQLAAAVLAAARIKATPTATEPDQTLCPFSPRNSTDAHIAIINGFHKNFETETSEPDFFESSEISGSENRGRTEFPFDINSERMGSVLPNEMSEHENEALSKSKERGMVGLVFANRGIHGFSVKCVVKDGPASRSTRPPIRGDVLIRVNATLVPTENFATLAKLMAGPPGSTIVMQFCRHTGEIFETKIRRGLIHNVQTDDSPDQLAPNFPMKDGGNDIEDEVTQRQRELANLRRRLATTERLGRKARAKTRAAAVRLEAVLAALAELSRPNLGMLPAGDDVQSILRLKVVSHQNKE